MNVLGIVTGLAFEADILRPYAGGALRVRAAGLAPEAAAAAARGLIDEGAGALMSFGIAGGLAPDAAPGDVIVPSAVAGARTLACDGSWTARLAELGVRGKYGTVLGYSPEVLTTAAQKSAFFAATGAVAADMESYGVATAALARGLPFVALRVVADAARDAVPPLALRSMGPDGRVRLAAAALGALARPWQIPELMTLAARTARAAAVLAALARAHAPRRFGLV